MSRLSTSFNDALSLSLVLHIGDLGYALGRDTIWDGFSAQIEPIAKDIPYMVAIGNHERGALETNDVVRPKPALHKSNDSAGECGVGSSNHDEAFIITFLNTTSHFPQFQ